MSSWATRAIDLARSMLGSREGNEASENIREALTTDSTGTIRRWRYTPIRYGTSIAFDPSELEDAPTIPLQHTNTIPLQHTNTIPFEWRTEATPDPDAGLLTLEAFRRVRRARMSLEDPERYRRLIEEERARERAHREAMDRRLRNLYEESVLHNHVEEHRRQFSDRPVPKVVIRDFGLFLLEKNKD